MGVRVCIFLGAAIYPYNKILSNHRFRNSKDDFEQYLLDAESGMGIDEEYVLDLFDSKLSAPQQLVKISNALKEWLPEEDSTNDLIIYYVGHGCFVDETYVLSIGSLRSGQEEATGLSPKSLANILRQFRTKYRKFIFLDCCYAAEALKSFQASGEVLDRKIVSAFDDKLPSGGSENPQWGTALFCASDSDTPAQSPIQLERTMFSDSLLETLKQGDSRLTKNFSFYELAPRVWSRLQSIHGQNAVRPNVHAPDQSSGDISRWVEIFPNAALLSKRQRMWGTLTTDVRARNEQLLVALDTLQSQVELDAEQRLREKSQFLEQMRIKNESLNLAYDDRNKLEERLKDATDALREARSLAASSAADLEEKIRNRVATDGSHERMRQERERGELERILLEREDRVLTLQAELHRVGELSVQNAQSVGALETELEIKRNTNENLKTELAAREKDVELLREEIARQFKTGDRSAVAIKEQMDTAQSGTKNRRLPFIGNRTRDEQQRALGLLIAVGLVISAGGSGLSIRASSSRTVQLAATGAALMQSERLAKAVSQAMIGSPAAFPEVRESATALDKNVIGLLGGNDITPLKKLVTSAVNNADIVLAQQKTLTQVGQALHTINRQSSDLLETAETVSSLKLQGGASAAEISAVGQLVMLTQRIGKSANEFLTYEGVSPEAVFLLGKDLNTFREIADGLLQGNADLRLPGTKEPATRERLVQLIAQYEQTRSQSSAILANLQGLVAAREAQAQIVSDSEPLRKGLLTVQDQLTHGSSMDILLLILIPIGILLLLAGIWGFTITGIRWSNARQP